MDPFLKELLDKFGSKTTEESMEQTVRVKALENGTLLASQAFFFKLRIAGTPYKEAKQKVEDSVGQVIADAVKGTRLETNPTLGDVTTEDVREVLLKIADEIKRYLS